MKPTELMAVLDFSENYRCASQDEAQSAYWNYQQVTIHPMVFTYNCSCQKELITESVIIVSNDLNHDAAAVQAFTKSALEHISTRGDFNRLIEFTDGCGSQYKSKQPFLDIQNSVAKQGIHIERHFFGSRHGKNPSDGEAAVIKSAATRAVKCRQRLIQNPMDFFNFGCAKLSLDGECVHYKRKFIYVDTETIQKERKNQKQDIKTLVGTRDLHVVKPFVGGGLLTRKLSCFCESCEGADGMCVNKEYTQDWEHHDMMPKTSKVIMFE